MRASSPRAGPPRWSGGKRFLVADLSRSRRTAKAQRGDQPSNVNVLDDLMQCLIPLQHAHELCLVGHMDTLASLPLPSAAKQGANTDADIPPIAFPAITEFGSK